MKTTVLKAKPLGIVLAIALLAGGAAAWFLQAQNQASQPVVAATSAQPYSDKDYATVLSTYVNANGLVNYEALQSNPERLQSYVAAIGSLSPATYATWNEKEKIAFLINAYNALTLQSIINQKPLKRSIKDIFGVWNFNTHQVIGDAKTLDTIEHQILRKEFNEPRIHAALVCAANSCPPLRQEPFTGANLNAQLDDQVRKWLASPYGLQIDRAQNRVAISSIFKWFGADWETRYRTEGKFVGSSQERAVLNFINAYLSPDDQAYLVQGAYKLSYLNYDWSLNKQ